MRERHALRRVRRPRRLRHRMLGALLTCTAAVLAAAAPGVALAAGDLSAAQDRVGSAATAERAVVLAQTLADERDALAAFAAADRDKDAGPGLAPADRARADRQLAEVRPTAPADVRTSLATLESVRRQALTGDDPPSAVMAAYQPLVDALGRLSGPVTAPLGRAADAAAAQRGYLVAALTADGTQRTLVAAAQSAGVQEQAALAEFRAVAPAALRARYDRTVTGADVAQADHDLDRLLVDGELTPDDRDMSASSVNTALTARLALVRGVVASAATDEARAAAADRDHRVTVLELRVALAVLCAALLVGVLVNLFRGINRPLAALHRWSRADPDSGQGTQVIGADEFAAVARRINALTHEAHSLRGRVHEITAQRTAAAEAGTALAVEREGLLRSREDLARSRDEIAARLAAAAARNAQQITYVNLSLRTLGLVERQLALIESLEGDEEDPDRLAVLFRLDHLATRMRRNSENLLVLTGTEHSHGATPTPVPLIDVARAAVSEIEAYERVVIRALPEALVAGRAADDISHLVAELLDNAAAFSAPGAEVHVSATVSADGEVLLCVDDTGLGVPGSRLDALNAVLADPDPTPPGAVSGMGLYVVARLAHRHAVRVHLTPRAGGGTTAVVALPRLLIPSTGPDATTPGPVRTADPLWTAGPVTAAGPATTPDAVRAAGPATTPGPVRAAGAALVPDSVRAAGAAPVPGSVRAAGAAPVPGSVRAAGAAPAPDSVPPAAGEPFPFAEPLPAGGPFPAGRAPVPDPAPAAPGAPAEPAVPGFPGPRAAQTTHPTAPVTPPRPAAPAVPAARLASAAPGPAAPGPVAPASATPTAPAALVNPLAVPAPQGGPAGAAAPAPAPRSVPPASSVPSAAPAVPVAGPPLTALPRRRPLGGGAVPGGPGQQRRAAPVDPEALRRTLGGLQRGLAAGRRDAERETAGGTGPFGASRSADSPQDPREATNAEEATRP